MEATERAPETLIEAVRYFADADNCLVFMVGIRWPNGIVCPRCASTEHSFLTTRRIWKCKGCKKQFSVKVGTIFEDSPLGLDKWLPALWMIANCKNGISSHELARHLDVTQKTAWFMLHRIRLAMQCSGSDMFGGTVEVDETYIGAKARNMHASKRERLNLQGRSLEGKAAVLGLLERHGEGASRVRTKVLKGMKGADLKGFVREHVETGAVVNTDSFKSYMGLAGQYEHNVINHAEEYVRGNVHTNGIENFWSLLKRAIKGTYVSVEPFHLFRYLDEQSYRFNARTGKDGDRFIEVLRQGIGRRLTYKSLTAANLPQQQPC